MKKVEVPGNIDYRRCQTLLDANLPGLQPRIESQVVILAKDVTTDEYNVIKAVFQLCLR